MKKIFTIIISFLAIFTPAKSFKGNPFIGSLILNIMGLHILRVVFSHIFFRIRLFQLRFLVNSKDRASFLNNGYIIKNDFLSKELFSKVKEEIKEYKGRVEVHYEGNTDTERVLIDEKLQNSIESLKKIIEYKPMQKIFRYTTSKNLLPTYFIENIVQKGREDIEDYQKECHMDTFHPSMKAWLFLDNVTSNEGSFVYYAKSHRLTFKRLKWEYKQSIKSSKNRNSSTNNWDGAFRISKEELKNMGYEPIKLEVKKNSLVLANVYGFHCRAEANKTTNRLAIWVQEVRDMPFNPFVLPFFSKNLNSFVQKTFIKFRNRRNQKKEKMGTIDYKNGFYITDVKTE